MICVAQAEPDKITRNFFLTFYKLPIRKCFYTIQAIANLLPNNGWTSWKATTFLFSIIYMIKFSVVVWMQYYRSVKCRPHQMVP